MKILAGVAIGLLVCGAAMELYGFRPGRAGTLRLIASLIWLAVLLPLIGRILEWW